jgi:hypothetical protein
MISMNLHDCRAQQPLREQLARDVERFLAEKGLADPPQVKGFERFANPRALTFREQITADIAPVKKRNFVNSSDGKHNERNAERMRLPVVRPDHKHDITIPMLAHAFRKLKVTKASVAKMMNRSQSYISNVCNGKAEASDEVRRVMLDCIWKLTEAK